MIFPGMDPYLEDPQIWPDLHSRLIVYIAEHLQPLLRPRYVTSIETRVFVEGPDRSIIPDVWLKRSQPKSGGPGTAILDADAPVEVEVPELEVHETFLEILDRQAGQRVVTVLEVVSPSNKFAGPGRESYLAKQREVLSSATHLVEIDLLRAGPHVLAVPEWIAQGKGPYDYLVAVNRAEGPRKKFQLYPRRLRERLPRIRVPLADDDPDVHLDLQAVLDHTYEMGGYQDRLDYDRPGVPPLSPENQDWATERVRAARQNSP